MSSPDHIASSHVGHQQSVEVTWHHKCVYWLVIFSFLLSGAADFGFSIWLSVLGETAKPNELIVGLSLIVVGLALFSIMGSLAAYRLMAFLVVLAAAFDLFALFIINFLGSRPLDWSNVARTMVALILAYGFLRPAAAAYARQYPKLVRSTRDA